MSALKKVDNSSYTATLNIGASTFKQLLWYITNILFFKNAYCISSSLKVGLLRRFGASVGRGVVIKPCVNIKYPWKLSVGNHAWIGEQVWIDNIAEVTIGDNVCLSQGSLLLTGNHNYKKCGFDLIPGAIILEDGVWIGAKAIVCPGVVCASHAILSVAAVANGNLQPYGIYKGNPAIKVGDRVIE